MISIYLVLCWWARVERRPNFSWASYITVALTWTLGSLRGGCSLNEPLSHSTWDVTFSGDDCAKSVDHASSCGSSDVAFIIAPDADGLTSPLVFRHIAFMWPRLPHPLHTRLRAGQNRQFSGFPSGWLCLPQPWQIFCWSTFVGSLATPLFCWYWDFAAADWVAPCGISRRLLVELSVVGCLKPN